MTVFNDTFDKAAPAGTDDPSEADDNMRRIQAAVQERENVDHYWPLTGTEVSDANAGEHRKVTFNQSIANPTQVASKAHLYMKDDELFYQDDTNTAKQLTNSGKLNIVDADGAVVKTGNQTIAGIKTFSSSPIVPAPTTDLQAATKKYVDAYIKLVDSRAAGTNGGAISSGSWVKRTIAEESDVGDHVAVSSSVIVLDAGTYQCRITAPAFAVDQHAVRLRNTTSGSTILVGSMEYASAAQNAQTNSVLAGIFTVAGSQNLEIQTRVSVTNGTNGGGRGASNLGEVNIFTIAEFWKR
jgi:hypothetical protein